jgi:hypothetical protein
MLYATQHFIRRVRERIGADVDAEALAAWLALGVTRSDPDVVFVARLNRSGGRVFRFRLADGRTFYALIDTDHMNCITVLPPGFTLPREGAGRLYLKDMDV